LSDNLHYLRKQFGSGLVDAYELLENNLQEQRDTTDYDKTTEAVLNMFSVEENDTLNKFIKTHDVDENDLRDLVEQR
jgi:predicted ATP-dependent Lon-type protease